MHTAPGLNLVKHLSIYILVCNVKHVCNAADGVLVNLLLRIGCIEGYIDIFILNEQQN